MTDMFGYENQKYDVVMFNMSTMHDWDHGVVNRNYNILNTLTHEPQINRIIAVDFFPIGIKKAAKHYWQNLLWEIKTSEMVYGDLTSACYQKTDKIYVYSSIDSIFSWKTAARELRRIEKALNLRNIIFWSYNPFFVEFIGKLREELFVFDTVDNWQEHPQYLKLMSKQKLQKNYQEIADSADMVFTVSEELLEFYNGMKRNQDTHWVPNGVNFEHYNDPEKLSIKNELTEIAEPIIGYMGTIQERVDFELIDYIAKENPDKKLVLCGPVWPSVENKVKALTHKYKNIILTDRVPYDKAPSYIDQFDVAIIPHKVDDFIKSTNPMKLYEYLAAGKPVVTTKGAGVYMFSDKISITNDYTEFNNFIKEELQTDSKEKIQLRKEAVKEHSWHARVEFMLDKILKKLEQKKSQEV